MKRKRYTEEQIVGILKAKGARVDVRAIYLPNRKLGPEALAARVSVARPPAIAVEMTASDTRLAIY